MQKDRFVKGKQASDILNVHYRTLYQWDKKGWIETKRTKSNMRLYNVDKYLRENNIADEIDNCLCTDNELDKLDTYKHRLNLSYVRVSSAGQKDDLKRQLKHVKNKYPKNKIIKDIGSGINLNRRGFS